MPTSSGAPGVIVIAIKRADGRLEFPPTGDEIFAPGDSVVLMGQRPNLDSSASSTMVQQARARDGQ